MKTPDSFKIDDRIIEAARSAGLDPEVLDWHTEAVHGWEAHDAGFLERGVAGAVKCLLAGGCETVPDAGEQRG